MINVILSTNNRSVLKLFNVENGMKDATKLNHKLIKNLIQRSFGSLQDYSVSISLPSGYTTTDIAKVHHDTEDIIVIFNDNAVYYSLEDEIETLVKADDLTNINTDGILDTMRYIDGKYIFVLEDGNAYQIKLG